MIGYRPCGMCVAYVPADTGCGHWRPGQKAEAPSARKNRNRDSARLRQRERYARQKAEVEAARERGRQIARGNA